MTLILRSLPPSLTLHILVTSELTLSSLIKVIQNQIIYFQ